MKMAYSFQNFEYPLYNTSVLPAKSDSYVTFCPQVIRRPQFGRYVQLIRAMRMEDSSSFTNYTKLEPPRVGPRIQKSDTSFRRVLEPGLELSSTARAYRKRGRSAKVDYA